MNKDLNIAKSSASIDTAKKDILNLLRNMADVDQLQRNLNQHRNMEISSLFTMEKFSQLVAFISACVMIFGGVVPYIPQYQIIKRSRNASGFSTFVCLSLLIANILRILFWFGHWFEYPLLAQSVIMIVCMLVMLELCIRVKSENNYANSTGTSPPKKFTDFDMNYFWKWTDFLSYFQFISCFIAVGAFLTYLFINSSFFIEFLGFASVFTEACLALPQFYKNFRNKSTEGMSLIMVLMWTSGDVFKTTYFLLRNSPTQFWVCGMLQATLDISVLSQVYIYSNKRTDSKLIR